MKLIIDIPDDLYKTKKALPGYMCGVMEKAVQNGTPLEQIRDEIEREADHYDAYVDQDIAKGLYYAGEIIDKYLNGGMSPEVKEHYEQLAEHYNKKGKKG